MFQNYWRNSFIEGIFMNGIITRQANLNHAPINWILIDFCQKFNPILLRMVFKKLTISKSRICRLRNISNPFLQKCRSTCLSVVVGRRHDNFRYNYQIKFSFCILYQSPKSKNKFVNQPYPTIIVKVRAFFVFLKKSIITILNSDSANKSLLIILITFFD